MGFFDSPEERARKYEEKQQKELQKFMDRYGLKNLSIEDLATIKRVASDINGNGLIKAGMALSFANASEQATVGYLSALVEQNWLIIKLLADLNYKLEDTDKIK